MITSKHTPGPWVADNGDSAVWVIAQNESGDVLAELMLDHGQKDAANARLISAAPDLLEALEEILDYRGGADSALADEYVVERARAAIRKATEGK